MRRPSFQFYPADWQGNSNLRRCTHTEKGAWIDLLCLFHDAEEYGVLRWPLAEIAQAIGGDVRVLQALVTKSVLKGTDAEDCEALIYAPRHGRREGEAVTLLEAQAGPIWYSSRMVVDEYVRQRRGESTRFEAPDSAPKQTPKAAPNHPPNAAPTRAPKLPFGDGSSSSSSPSVNVEGKPSTAPAAPGGNSRQELTDEPDPIFGGCLAFLASKGCATKGARSFLGLMRKTYGDAAIVEGIERAERMDVSDPIPWLRKYLEGKPKAKPAAADALGGLSPRLLA